ncbi:MAG: hypothetical protein V1773_01885 [bacterium]
MERTAFETYKTKTIFMVSFIGLGEIQEIKKIIERAKSEISKQPYKSVLLLTDITATNNDKDTLGLLKDFANHNTPYIKASAVAGVTGIKKNIFPSLVESSGRYIHPCQSVKEAQDWLISQ